MHFHVQALSQAAIVSTDALFLLTLEKTGYIYDVDLAQWSVSQKVFQLILKIQLVWKVS